MANTDVYTLERSDLNMFLFADVGVEASGMTLTVLSVLSRLGMDPWQEAGRLARLPRTAATEGLAGRIAALPASLWSVADATAIAARLVALLPARDAGASVVATAPAASTMSRTGQFQAGKFQTGKFQVGKFQMGLFQAGISRIGKTPNGFADQDHHGLAAERGCRTGYENDAAARGTPQRHRRARPAAHQPASPSSRHRSPCRKTDADCQTAGGPSAAGQSGTGECRLSPW